MLKDNNGSPDQNSLERTDLQPIIYFIVAATWPEKFFLLEHQEFGTPGSDSFISFLIVLPDNRNSSFEGLQSGLELISLNGCRVSFFLVKSEDLPHALSNGHLFYSSICKKDKLVYDNGLVPLPATNASLWAYIRKKAEEEFEIGLGRAAAFLDGASFYLERKSRDLAAFMLHQATEGTYRTIIHVLNGMEKKTHCIRSLAKHCRGCAPQLSVFFPADNWQEERLLKLIEDAYLDTRYRDTYEISDRELDILFARVERLQRAAKQVFEERMTCLAIQ